MIKLDTSTLRFCVFNSNGATPIRLEHSFGELNLELSSVVNSNPIEIHKTLISSGLNQYSLPLRNSISLDEKDIADVYVGKLENPRDINTVNAIKELLKTERPKLILIYASKKYKILEELKKNTGLRYFCKAVSINYKNWGEFVDCNKIIYAIAREDVFTQTEVLSLANVEEKNYGELMDYIIMTFDKEYPVYTLSEPLDHGIYHLKEGHKLPEGVVPAGLMQKVDLLPIRSEIISLAYKRAYKVVGYEMQRMEIRDYRRALGYPLNTYDFGVKFAKTISVSQTDWEQLLSEPSPGVVVRVLNHFITTGKEETKYMNIPR